VADISSEYAGRTAGKDFCDALLTAGYQADWLENPGPSALRKAAENGAYDAIFAVVNNGFSYGTNVLRLHGRVARNMMDRYRAADRVIQIIELNDSYQMSTKQTMYEAIIKIAHGPKKHVLTEVLLETLSIVAYKQPITRQEIEAIRGVSCDHAVNKLVEYGLIAEIGRLDAPGRPILFGTTEDFLRSFGLASLEELPIVKPEKVEDFKIEAEEEIQLKLDI
jgi:segregation and condensation protein B